MITQREAKQIVDFVMKEIQKRQFPYTTDGRVDFTKGTVGTIHGGTTITGGQISNNSIYDRHINSNASIAGTKIKLATVSEVGTVELAQPTETASGLVVQANDYRLHDVVVSTSTQHDTRYWTKDQLASTLHDYGADLIGVEDPSGYFIGQNVGLVLNELFDLLQEAIAGSGITFHGNEYHVPDFISEADFANYESATSGILDSLDSRLDDLDQAQATKKVMYIKVIPDTTSLSVGDGQSYITIPFELDGMTMVNADASVYTYSTSGLPTINIYNLTDLVDMLSIPITIGVSGYNSYTAAIQPVIISGGVAIGDRIRIDVDVSGTGTKGLDVILAFQST